MGKYNWFEKVNKYSLIHNEIVAIWREKHKEVKKIQERY